MTGCLSLSLSLIYLQMEQPTCNIYNAIVEQYNNTMIHRYNNVHIINNTLQQYQYQCGATIQHCAYNISHDFKQATSNQYKEISRFVKGSDDGQGHCPKYYP